jgi:putative redox protein
MQLNKIFEKPIYGKIGVEKYKTIVVWRNGEFITDEPVSSGGKDLGPDPYTLLLSSLAACTLATLRMYIDQKQWQIPEIFVEVNMSQEKDDYLITTIERKISFNDAISEEQKERLLLIAKKCPVSRLLENQIVLSTKI